MPASKNSVNSPASNSVVAFFAIAVLGTLAAWLCWSRGYSFFYGDAEAHLNIARRIFDSRTPNVQQVGTVWLPLPHLLMAPLARVDALWINGLAGVIPSVLAFALAGAFLYSAAVRAFGSVYAGVAAALLFATNPSMLYLQATPMTEPLMGAALAGLLLATLRYRDAQTMPALLLVAAVSNLASLIRYEAWFLIPFVTLFVLLTARNRQHAYVFGMLAAIAPLGWILYNQIYFGNALAFYNGPYSARAIFARQLTEGMVQPAAGNLRMAAKYYFTAVIHVLGLRLLTAMGVGVCVALYKRAWWPIALLALPAVFYVWSIRSAGTPVFVPELEPYTRYNTRYALALLPLAAFAGSAVFSLLRSRALALLLGALILVQLRLPAPMVFEEARIASAERREWTAQAAQYLKENYRPGDGIVFWFGDLTPVLRAAGIPLREGVYQDNGAQWDAAFANNRWALAIEGDPVDELARRAGFRTGHRIAVKGAKAVIFYRPQNP